IDTAHLCVRSVEALPKGMQVVLNLEGGVGALIGLDDGVIEWRCRASLAGEFRGDALKDLGRQMRVHQDGHLRLSEHVDESGSDYHAVRVNGALGRRGAEKPDGGNTPVANADVAGIPGRAGAVDDVAVADDDVVGDLSGAGGEKAEDGESRDQQRSKISGHVI